VDITKKNVPLHSMMKNNALDVEGIAANISTAEIVDFVRAGRERHLENINNIQ
jgi:hypothetical protein